MAEALLRHALEANAEGNSEKSLSSSVQRVHAPDSDLAVESLSAGVYAGEGMPASQHSVEALDDLGIDLRYFRSQPVTPELIDSCDLIFAMTRQHRDTLVEWFPEVREKVFLIKEFADPSTTADVADPYSLDLSVYRRCRDEIRACIPGIVKFLKQ